MARLRAAILTLLLSSTLEAYPTAQIQYSWPLRLGGELGVNFYDFVGFSPTLMSGGPFVSASAGRDGIGLNAGLKGSVVFMIPLGTASIGASGLYLWEGENAAYAGIRASAGMRLLTFFGGAYRRVSGDREDDWMFSRGAGIGMP